MFQMVQSYQLLICCFQHFTISLLKEFYFKGNVTEFEKVLQTKLKSELSWYPPSIMKLVFILKLSHSEWMPQTDFIGTCTCVCEYFFVKWSITAFESKAIIDFAPRVRHSFSSGSVRSCSASMPWTRNVKFGRLPAIREVSYTSLVKPQSNPRKL